MWLRPAACDELTNAWVVCAPSFAIAGLRSLYRILSKAVSELKYLEKAVGLVLAVISVKLGGEAFGVEVLSPLESLLAVLGVLGMGIAASLWGDDGGDLATGDKQRS